MDYNELEERIDSIIKAEYVDDGSEAFKLVETIIEFSKQIALIAIKEYHAMQEKK